MLRLMNLSIRIIHHLEPFLRNFKQRRSSIRLWIISLLTLIVILTGIPTATAQFPFFPTSVNTSSNRGKLIFSGALNKPYNCGNFQVCSHVWMKGQVEPLLIVASPSITEDEQNSSLPVDLRAKRIQQRLNGVRDKILSREQSNFSDPSLSFNNNFTEKNLLQPIQEDLIDSTVFPLSENTDGNLHPFTPQIGVALENNIPVVYLPVQKGFLKKTILQVRDWDLLPNEQLLMPDNPQKQQEIEQWFQEFSASDQNFYYEQIEQLILAKIWASRIQTQFSNSLKDQDRLKENSQDFIILFLVILAIILLSSVLLFWIQKRVKAQRNQLHKRLKELEKSFTISPDTSYEDLAAQTAQAEELVHQTENADSTQTNQQTSSFSNSNPINLTSYPFNLVTARVDKLWQYLTNDLLKQQNFLKQKMNLMLFFENLLFWGQACLWGFGIVTLMFVYPPARIPEIFGIFITILPIAQYWIFFTIANKIADFGIDFLLNRWATEAQKTSSTPQRYTMRVKTYSTALSQLNTFMTYGLATFFSILTLGFSLEGLTQLGILTAVITFIFQPQITNVIRGFLILVMDQFAIGDVISVNNSSGMVEDMNLYMTYLRGKEGRLISIPNGEINTVENLTKEWSRVDFTIEIAYDADIKRALEVIHHVVEEMRCEPQWQDLILEPAAILGVDSLTHNGVLIQVWIKTQPTQQWAVGREFRLRIKLAFDREGILIGMPQQRLWYRDEQVLNQGESDHYSKPQAL